MFEVSNGKNALIGDELKREAETPEMDVNLHSAFGSSKHEQVLMGELDILVAWTFCN